MEAGGAGDNLTSSYQVEVRHLLESCRSDSQGWVWTPGRSNRDTQVWTSQTHHGAPGGAGAGGRSCAGAGHGADPGAEGCFFAGPGDGVGGCGDAAGPGDGIRPGAVPGGDAAGCGDEAAGPSDGTRPGGGDADADPGAGTRLGDWC